MAANTSVSATAGSFFGSEATSKSDSLVTITFRGTHLSYYVAISCILLATYLFRSRRKSYIDVPFFKAGLFKWMFDAENLIRQSYEQYYGKVYQIKATEGVQVLVPPTLIGELKGLPEDVLSASAAVSEAMMSDYTKFSLGRHTDLLSALVRTKLTQNLVRLVPQLRVELEHILATEFPECADWTPVKIQPIALRSIARLSGRAFVGPELNRNEEWMDTSINFAIHVFLAVVKLQFFPTWLRPVGQYLVSDLRKIQQDIARAKGMLQPIIEERIQNMETPGYERPDDLIQWLVEALPESERSDFGPQTELQLVLSAASIHTTNNLLVECIFDLAARPEVQEMLREEAHEVLVVDGGWARKDCFPRLKKTDSFIKEVQRLAGNVTGFIRKVIKPIDLSDGTRLPPGTKLLAPQAGISHDERYFPSPNEFDALRFWRLRQQCPEDSNRHQFTTICDANMNFGAGKHACPGRFFAGNELKLVLTHLLLNYDMKLKDGDERPKPMLMMMSKAPNPNTEIMFRRRSAAA